MPSVIYLDALTKDNNYRITTFGDKITQAIRDYMAWVKENNLVQDDVEYANVYEYISKDNEILLASLVVNEDGTCEAIPPECEV